jgi:hypothetical protein
MVQGGSDFANLWGVDNLSSMLLANLFWPGESCEFPLSDFEKSRPKTFIDRVRQRYLLAREDPTAKQPKSRTVLNELTVLLSAPHRGTWGRSFPQVLFAVAFATAISYRGRILPQFPVSDGPFRKCARNAEIRARHQKGESITTLAMVFGITEQRIWQILNGRRR